MDDKAFSSATGEPRDGDPDMATAEAKPATTPQTAGEPNFLSSEQQARVSAKLVERE
jgi:hypothetical protein